MTSTTLPDEVLKTDLLGRVRIKKAQHEALLDEFERGSASGRAFAKLIGINYQTFPSLVGAQAVSVSSQNLGVAASHHGSVAIDGSGRRSGRRPREQDALHSSARRSTVGGA